MNEESKSLSVFLVQEILHVLPHLSGTPAAAGISQALTPDGRQGPRVLIGQP